MDVNRTPLTEAEQDWIDKYRAALDNTPIPTSRLRRMRNKLIAARLAFADGMKRIFGSQEKGSQGKAALEVPANSSLPTANSKLQTPPRELRKPSAQDAITPNKKRGKRGSKAS